MKNLYSREELINKNWISEAYTVAKKLISDNLQNFIDETKDKFNKALASHDGLQTQEIEEYKNAIEYIKNSQIFDGHFDLKEISQIFSNKMLSLSSIK